MKRVSDDAQRRGREPTKTLITGAERRRPPLRSIGLVTRRRGLRSSALVVDSHARTAGLLGFLPTNKPLLATNVAHHLLAGSSTACSGSSAGKRMNQAPAGPCICSLIFCRVRPWHH